MATRGKNEETENEHDTIFRLTPAEMSQVKLFPWLTTPVTYSTQITTMLVAG